MTYKDDRLVMRKSSSRASSSRRSSKAEYGIGIAARITEDTHLVVPAQNGMRPERLHHRHPGHRRILKTVHEDDRNLVWIIRLDLYQSRDSRTSLGLSIAANPIFSGCSRVRPRAIGAVKSAFNGRIRPETLTVSLASGSMNWISHLRPVKWATAVAAL